MRDEVLQTRRDREGAVDAPSAEHSPRSLTVAARQDPAPCIYHNAHDGAAAAEPIAAPPLATMLTRHILRDGEIVILTLKPSIWFILFSWMRFCAIVLILMIAIQIFYQYAQAPYRARVYIEVGILVLAGRVMWAVLQWMSRLYILTDLRILILSGVFNAEIFDCPLRKVGRTRIVRTMKDRPLNLGSIEIIPFDENLPIGMWQTIPRPKEVHQQMLSAISRAKQGPGACA